MAKYSYHQLDRNHAEIRAALEAVGATVDTHSPLDLTVGYRGATYLFEVKTAHGKIRPSQQKFLTTWKGHAVVVRTVAEALRAIGLPMTKTDIFIERGSHMATLICEGPCNPQIKDIDARVSSAARTSQGQPPIGSDALWKAQRTLRYTEHIEKSEFFFTCTVCGTTRRWGCGKWEGLKSAEWHRNPLNAG